MYLPLAFKSPFMQWSTSSSASLFKTMSFYDCIYSQAQLIYLVENALKNVLASSTSNTTSPPAIFSPPQPS
jgi:hypothetical protein